MLGAPSALAQCAAMCGEQSQYCYHVHVCVYSVCSHETVCVCASMCMYMYVYLHMCLCVHVPVLCVNMSMLCMPNMQ